VAGGWRCQLLPAPGPVNACAVWLGSGMHRWRRPPDAGSLLLDLLAASRRAAPGVRAAGSAHARGAPLPPRRPRNGGRRRGAPPAGVWRAQGGGGEAPGRHPHPGPGLLHLAGPPPGGRPRPQPPRAMLRCVCPGTAAHLWGQDQRCARGASRQAGQASPAPAGGAPLRPEHHLAVPASQGRASTTFGPSTLAPCAGSS
jgi:hypothetical protein